MVTLVAVGASRSAFYLSSHGRMRRGRSRFPAMTMDALLHSRFDELVAFGACCRHVQCVQRGSSIGRVIDAVSPVTIGTDRCYGQSRLIESPAMHRHFICLLVFRMARAACANLIIQKHRRVRILDREYAVRVCPMALAAVHWQSPPSNVLVTRLGMHSLEQAKPLVVMADATSAPEFADRDQADMGLGKFRAAGIASVAIRTNDALCKVGIVLQVVDRHKKPLVGRIPQGRFCVAGGATVGVERDFRTGQRDRWRLGLDCLFVNGPLDWSAFLPQHGRAGDNGSTAYKNCDGPNAHSIAPRPVPE